jgi:DNA-binding response OmpR family regulator
VQAVFRPGASGTHQGVSVQIGKTQQQRSGKDHVQRLFIDTISRSVYIDDGIVRLTPKEYRLLFFLSRTPTRRFPVK